MKTILCLSLMCLLVSLSGLASAKTFYRWEDAQGVTHYTTNPPKAEQSTSVDVMDGGPESNTSQDSNNKTSAAKTNKTAETPSTTTEDNTNQDDATTFKKRCEKYHENLKKLNSKDQLFTKNDNGEKQVVGQKKRAKMKAHVKNMLKTCPPAE